MVQRYKIDFNWENYGADDNGDWVKYTDHRKVKEDLLEICRESGEDLVSQLEEARAFRQKILKENERLCEVIENLRERECQSAHINCRCH